jgi:hypothetical protein
MTGRFREASMDVNAAVPAAAPVDGEALAKQVKSGTSWFFWIAALSLVNSVMTFTGSDRSFLVGLAVTQTVDAVAKMWIANGGPAGLSWVALGLDVVIFGILVALGVLSRKRTAAYVVGIALYGLDAVLCAVLEVWTHLGFHALALFFLWRGLGALRQLRAMQAPAPAMAPNRLVR